GFLLFGSNHNRDLRRQKMKYPVNSSIYFISSLTTLKSEGASDTRTVTTIFGVTIDFFFFNPLVYLSTKASVYNLQGNSFVTMGAGLGFEF
ncbi:MAG: hypothetical protein KDD35_06495, partial [Bdellovibrionales bacterium]|nr:hypothetical protein [Bdellovibrionales bacterium]